MVNDSAGELQARLEQLEARLHQELEHRRRRDACDQALSGLRQLVRSMQRGDDLPMVTAAVGSCLDQAEVPYHAYGVNFIRNGDDEPKLTQVLRTTRGAKAMHVKNLLPGSPVAQSWQQGVVVYRPDLLADDPYGELDTWARDAAPAPRRSIVDVPFSHGTLAINSLKANAFNDFDIWCLHQIAEVLTEAMQRWADLGQLEERNRELAQGLEEGARREAELSRSSELLADRDRLLSAFHETGKVLLTTIDADEILDTLSLQVIKAGVFRSITVALVDEGAQRVRVVRGYIRHRGTDGLWTPLQQEELSDGISYELKEDNIFGAVGLSGVMEVIEGWDRRYDARRPPLTATVSLAYFIPVVHKGRAIAVLATGSSLGEREGMLRRIHMLRPFFDQVAIALYHARLYEELQERERDLRRAQKMEVMGELTAGIAHNFNNLLQGVTGNLELAMEDAEAEVRVRLADALSVVNTQAELVRQLMAYSRHGAEVTRKLIEPGPLLETVANICRNTFDRRIEFITELDPNLPMILGDSAQLQQAVLNLCMNARDAVVEQGGHHSFVALRACLRQEEERTVSISVQDNGVGIDGAVRERIFDPFFTTKEVGSGTGLGLSIVHGIMRRHGGRITCDSRIGEGTMFQLLLPTAEAGTATSVKASEPPPPKGHETILIVDDEESVRTTIGHALSRLGYRVLLAADGEQGLAVLAREGAAVDLMLLDLSMPRLSGSEVLERMDPDSGPAVILFTGFAASHDLSGRVTAVLEKPLLPRTLIHSVRAVLDERQS